MSAQLSSTLEDGIAKREVVSRWRVHFFEKFPVEFAPPLLIASCFITGMVDASMYNAWTVFAAMQTGNTMFLALGASNQPLQKPYGWSKSLMSIFWFWIGAFVNTRIANSKYTPAPTARITLMVSYTMQALAVYVAAALVEAGFVYGSGSTYKVHDEVDFKQFLPLALLAIQFGAQISTSRMLGVSEVPTTVLTSVYTDIAMDPGLVMGWGANPKRNNRILSIICMLCGGIAGGWISRSHVGLAGTLWVAGSIKLVVAILWTVLGTKIGKGEEERD